MSTLTHRERVVMALNHEEPDRVPLDLGGLTNVAAINVTAYKNLMKHLGLHHNGDVVGSHRNLLAAPCEALLQRFDIDLRGIDLGKSEMVPDEVIDENSFRDEWGVVWVRPEGGHFITHQEPFKKKEPTLKELERYPWPTPDDPARLRGVRERAQQLREQTDYALVLNLHCNIVHWCQCLRGFGEWLEDLLTNPALAEALMEHVLHINARIATFVLEEVGDLVDVVLIADDLGFQDRPYLRPELYRQKVKPFHRRLVEAIKGKTRAKVVMHSDGSICALLPDLIDIGVDAINPVQVSAREMDTRRLKAEFGNHLGFWGAVDTNWVLPRGSPEDVRREVQRRIRDLAPGGGYVLASVHNILEEVPPQNIVAMFDAALEYGRYQEPALR